MSFIDIKEKYGFFPSDIVLKSQNVPRHKYQYL